jgi:hypothetical protein
MKTLIRCAILNVLITQLLIGGVTSKHQEWRNGFLILTYNNTTKIFPGWTADAHYFWNGGSELSQPTSISQTDDSIISTVNNHRTKLSSHAKIIKSLDDQIVSLIAINKRMLGELDRMHTLAFTRVWTDIDGNSFTGVFIEYDLGAVKVRKVLDDTIYTIPAGRLTPACKEMALALDKFN